MVTRRAVLAFLLLVLAVGLAGCGSDGEEAGDAAGTTAGAGGGETAPTDDYSRGGAGAKTSDDAGGTLHGSVGPGFEISLEGTDGLTAGDYTITVDDRASAHNFHLTGPGGVDVSTSVGGEGEETFEVTLEPGEYTFVCDPHASQLNGTFTVD